MIVVLWRAGLRVQGALALAEHDLDQRRGWILVRRGKSGRRQPWRSSPMWRITAMISSLIGWSAALERRRRSNSARMLDRGQVREEALPSGAIGYRICDDRGPSGPSGAEGDTGS
jgi:hypothetical protein